MKRVMLNLMVILMMAATLQGCYGKFALTRKIYQVNGQVGDKFLRSGLTWVFLLFPVYAISGLADFIVFNTIEFWSGHNPVVEGEKDFQYVKGTERFDVHATKQDNKVTYSIAHYNYGMFVDSMEITWDQTLDTAISRHNQGGTITENSAVRKEGGVVVQNLKPGLLMDAVAIAN